MPTLNKNYITDKFKLPDTNILVLLNGIHQPELSDAYINSTFKNQTLKIPQNTKVEQPIHLLFITSQSCDITLDIIAEKNSYATIIEEHISLGDSAYINNIETNINTKNHSEIIHYKIQTENIEQSNHQTKTHINQEQNSKITSFLISKGAKTSSDTLHIKLAEENASYDIKGINLLCDTQTMNQQIRIEHLVPNCTSNVLFKSIVDDQATNNFDCRIVAYPNTTKTQTHVTNKNLLLSETATANTSPELEVYVDDVICTHGATVGQLDLEAIFYLRSRGIAKDMATKLLTAAFVQEITDQFIKYDRLKIAMDLNYGQ